MPNTYTIVLKNENAKKYFVFFQAQPEVSGGGGDDPKQILSSVWVSKGCPGGGNITVTAAVQFYSWAGTVQQAAEIGTKVVGGKALPATIGHDKTSGSKCTFNASYDDSIVDLVAAPKDDADAGKFAIDTTKFTASDNVLIGMAKPDSSIPDLCLPTMVINATGQMRYQIKPKNDYFVYVSESGVGEVFDYEAWSKNAGKIEFSKHAGTYTALVTYTSDGSWKTTY